MSVTAYQSTRRHVRGKLNFHQNRCEKHIKSHLYNHLTTFLKANPNTRSIRTVSNVYKLFTYLLTYLLTPYSRVLLEKLTGFAANQEIPRILWNPTVHYRTHKRPQTCQIFIKTEFKIITRLIKSVLNYSFFPNLLC